MPQVYAVILAGGLGTRMRPLTRRRPKPLLPVGGVPLALRQLRRLHASGIADVVLATAYHADQFAAVVSTGRHAGMRVDTSYEDEPLGTAGALARAAGRFDLEERDLVVVVNGDQLSGHDVARQVEAFRRSRDALGASAGIHARDVDDARDFGLLDVDADGRVHRFVEKPAEPIGGTVNAGTYVVTAEALSHLDPRGVSSLEREFFPRLIEDGVVVVAHRQDAYCLDVGTPAALVRASRDAVLREHGERLVEDDATLHPRAAVTDGSFVGSGAIVAMGATVSGSIVMPHAHIGADASVVDSVVGPGSMIGMGATVDGSAVGDGATVSDHAILDHTSVDGPPDPD